MMKKYDNNNGISDDHKIMILILPTTLDYYNNDYRFRFIVSK